MVSGARWLRAVEVTVQLLIFWDLSRELHFDAVDEILPDRAAAVLLRPAWVERFHLILNFHANVRTRRISATKCRRPTSFGGLIRVYSHALGSVDFALEVALFALEVHADHFALNVRNRVIYSPRAPRVFR